MRSADYWVRRERIRSGLRLLAAALLACIAAAALGNAACSEYALRSLLSLFPAQVFAAVAGLTSDANILINYARLAAQRYRCVGAWKLVAVVAVGRAYYTLCGNISATALATPAHCTPSDTTIPCSCTRRRSSGTGTVNSNARRWGLLLLQMVLWC